MSDRLQDFYFNIALETARTEYLAVKDSHAEQTQELTTTCVMPSRAEAIAHSQPSPGEIEHLNGCEICARLVQTFRTSSVEKPTPTIALLLGALKRYGKATERVAAEWVEIAKENARIFTQGIGEWAFQNDASLLPGEFNLEGMVVQLDFREEIGQFVVEVTTRKEELCGEVVTIVLVGGTGEELRVPVRLKDRKGDMCYGSAVATGHGREVIKTLGPMIIPVVLLTAPDL
jgi:hypothetical protein